MRTCVLLASPIRFISRVTRSIRTLSGLGEVSLFYVEPTESDRRLFDDHVSLHPVPPPDRRPSWVRKNIFIHREFDFLADAAAATGETYDIVLANDFPTVNGGVRLAERDGAVLIYDSIDLYLETVNQFFPDDAPFPKNLAFAGLVRLVRNVERVVERRLMGRVDLLITANTGYEEYLKRHYRPRRSQTILNCPELPDVEEPAPIREKLGFAETEKIVLYQGLMNSGRGLRQLVSSAKHLPEGIRIVILGWGVLEEKLREIARRDGTEDRVVFAGLVEQDELPAWTAAADIGVLLLEPFNISKRLSSAIKIYEYMAAGLPILTADLPGNRVVKDECAGWLIDDLTPRAVARAIETALGDEDERARRGRNGRRAAEGVYNWACQEELFLSALRPLLQSR